MKMSILKKILLFPFFILLFFKIWGQTDSAEISNTNYLESTTHKRLDLLLGYQFSSNHFAEIGLKKVIHKTKGSSLRHTVFEISNEFKTNDDFIWGLKTGLNISGGCAGSYLGLNLVNYTDFDNYSLRLRPEAGLSFGNIVLFYGYNAEILDNDLEGISDHIFGIKIYFNLNKSTHCKYSIPFLKRK